MTSPFPTPIRRPSSADGSALVRKFIDELSILHGKLGVSNGVVPPQPVFSPLLTTDVETPVTTDTMSSGSFEIDLDEDGPLREEYVPKRRASQRSVGFRNSYDARSSVHNVPLLPPPSEWSPQADPPVGERRGRRDVYLPVEPYFGSSGYPSHTRSFSVENSTGNSVWGAFKPRELHEPYGPISYQPFVYPTSHSVACPVSYSRTTLTPPSTLPSSSGNLRPRSMFYGDEAYTTSVTCGQHIGYPLTFAPHAHADSAPLHLRSVWLRT